MELENLGLSHRAYNGLRRSGFHTIESISGLTFDEILSIRGIGATLAVEIWDKLDEYQKEK